MRQLLLAACFLAPVMAEAASFDGQWAVEATTQVGGCEKAFTGEFVVAQGALMEVGSSTPAGYVEANGAAWARITRGAQIARAQGKFSGSRASGAWSSSTSYCGGSWSAHKLR